MKIYKEKETVFIEAEPGFQLACWNKTRGGISHYYKYGEKVRELHSDFTNDINNNYWWYFIEVPYYEDGHIVYEEDVPEFRMKYRIVEYNIDSTKNTIHNEEYSHLMVKKRYEVQCQEYDESDKLYWCDRGSYIDTLDAALHRMRMDINFRQSIGFGKLKKRQNLYVLKRDEYVMMKEEDFKYTIKDGNRINGVLISSTDMYYSLDYMDCENKMNEQYQLCKREIEYKNLKEGDEYVLKDWTPSDDGEEEPNKISVLFEYIYKEPKTEPKASYPYRHIRYYIEVVENGLKK